MKKQIFIDTDVGLDDIIAILMLIKSRKFKLSGFSTVFGLTRPEIGKNNLEIILNKLGIKLPVLTGSYSAIKGGGKFPALDIERSENYFKKIETQNRQNICIEDEIFSKFSYPQDLVALGPLTNIAKTIQKYGPAFSSKVKRIVLMGGGLNSGNVPGKLAEYNIWLDPEAAKIVFSSKIQIVMVGTDATQFVPATKKFKNKIRVIKPKDIPSRILKEVICFNDSDFDFFYDPLLSAILIDSTIVLEQRMASINVDLALQRGRTVVQNGIPKNVTIPTSIDTEKFYELLLQIAEN